MRVFITGAGMIGSYAAAELKAGGHEVTFLDPVPNEAYIRSVVPGTVEIRRGDAADFPTLMEALLSARFDCVIHTAGMIGGLAQRNFWRAMQANVVSTLCVAEAAHLAGAPRVIYCSTHGVYDTDRCKDRPMDESSPTSNDTVYGAGKLSAENILHAASGAYGLDVIILRFSNVYGRGSYVGGSTGGQAFNALIEPVALGQTGAILPAIKGRGEWLYVKDAAVALRLATERSERSGYLVACVGTGTLTTEQDVMEAIRQEVPEARFEEPAVNGPVSRARERFQPYDLGQAREALGYTSQWNLRQGVADYIREMRGARPA